MKFCVEDSVMLFGFLCTGICFFTRYLKPYLHGQKNMLTSILKNLSEKKIYKVNLLRETTSFSDWMGVPPRPECAMLLNIMTSCEIVHAIVAMVTTFPQKAAKKYNYHKLCNVWKKILEFSHSYNVKIVNFHRRLPNETKPVLRASLINHASSN